MRMYVLKPSCPGLTEHKLGFLCPHAWIYIANFSQRVTVGWLPLSLHPIMVDVGETLKLNYHLFQINKMT